MGEEKVKVPACWSMLRVSPSSAPSTPDRARGSPVGEVSLSRGETTTLVPATARTWSALAIGTAVVGSLTSTVSVPEAVCCPSETTSSISRVPMAPETSRTVTTPSLVVRTSKPSPWAETR